MAKINGDGGHNNLRGTHGPDVIKGRGGDDTIEGGGGKDDIFGGAGDDDLIGGPRNDKIEGGKGDDFIDGRAGDDTLNGGGGNDTFFFNNDEFTGDPRDYSGFDLVTGFTRVAGIGGDRIELEDAPFGSWSSMESGGNTIFTFTDIPFGVMATVTVQGVTGMVVGDDWVIIP